MGISISDIAEKSGVSIAAVSMALNGKKGVSEKTREHILKIARELNYINDDRPVKNNNTMKNVLLFLSGPDYNYFRSTFYWDAMNFFVKELSNEPVNIILQMSTLSQDIENIKKVIENNDISAAVFFSLRLPEAQIGKILSGIPCIFINRPNVDSPDMYSVCSDNFQSSYLLTQHMIELGHEDIVFMGYLPGVASTEERLRGYTEALKKADIRFNEQNVIYAEHFQEVGYIETRKLINSYTQLPSAMVCGNDFLAIGAIEALLDANFNVPADISVAGIQNTINSHLLKVPLTTIKVPHERLGIEAANKIKMILKGETPEKNTILSVELIPRESTARLNPNRRKARDA